LTTPLNIVSVVSDCSNFKMGISFGLVLGLCEEIGYTSHRDLKTEACSKGITNGRTLPALFFFYACIHLTINWIKMMKVL